MSGMMISLDCIARRSKQKVLTLPISMVQRWLLFLQRQRICSMVTVFVLSVFTELILRYTVRILRVVLRWSHEAIFGRSIFACSSDACVADCNSVCEESDIGWF